MQPTVDLFRSAAWSWGDNSFGASGLTLHSRASWPLPTPVELTKGNVSFVALGGGPTRAVTKRGHAYSWGRNEVGQLGVGDASRTTRALPSWVPLHSPVAMVAAGARHSVALLQDGSVYAWGANDCGQPRTGEMPGATTATFGRRRGAYAAMRPLLSEQQARWPRRVPKLPNAKGGRVYAWLRPDVRRHLRRRGVRLGRQLRRHRRPAAEHDHKVERREVVGADRGAARAAVRRRAYRAEEVDRRRRAGGAGGVRLHAHDPRAQGRRGARVGQPPARRSGRRRRRRRGDLKCGREVGAPRPRREARP